MAIGTRDPGSYKFFFFEKGDQASPLITFSSKKSDDLSDGAKL